MKRNNICKFPQQEPINGNITAISFVYESNSSIMKEPKIQAFYTVNCVADGCAVLHYDGKEYNLSVGDVFFTIPGVKFHIDCEKDFSYYYVGFLGKRAQQLMDEINANKQNPVKFGVNEVCEVFKMGIITATQQNFNLVCESVLLFTFGAIKKHQLPSEKTKESKLISEVRLFIDENFSNSDLSLKSVSEHFSYNPKYLSSLFKNVVGVSFSSYVTRHRINYALTLLEQGVTSVKDISLMCGFNDPLYFSKVFKKRTGKSPSEYKL